MIKSSYNIALDVLQKNAKFDKKDKFFEISNSDWVPVHISNNDVLLNSFFVSNEHLEGYQTQDILSLDYSTASECVFFGEGLEETVIEGLNNSVLYPLVFLRGLPGRSEYTYFELLQKFIHASGLIWVPSKDSYCLLDENGDLEEKIIIHHYNEANRIILVDRDVLDLYLLYSNQFLLKIFEIRDKEKHLKNLDETEIYEEPLPMLWTVNYSPCFTKGGQIITPNKSISDILDEKKQYVDYIIYDMLDNKELSCSCAPGESDTIFTRTGKPLETSPAFFKPEVLLKYKNDPDKYEISERSIDCKGGWSLQNFDVNEAGQVHVYLCYLRNLPFKEQQYWKNYNVPRKCDISQRALKTDFFNEFDRTYDPLISIKEGIIKFPKLSLGGKEYIIWKPKEAIEKLLNSAQPVISENYKEFQDFLLNLTKLVIEGLQTKVLKEIISLNIEPEESLSSLSALEQVLKLYGVSNTDNIIKSLRNLQGLRSKIIAHGGGERVKDTKSEAKDICLKIDQALKLLYDEISAISTRNI